jgi:hypothetical protein
MQKLNQVIIGVTLSMLLSLFASTPAEKSSNDTKPGDQAPVVVLWKAPANIASRDLYYGPGGKEDAPRGPYVFIKEDPEGTNPKFDIRDSNGTEWKVKLGLESRPETAASRLVWAIGYFASEDYYLPRLQVENLPAHLHRGQEFVASDGSITNARLKRYPAHTKKTANWRWKENPFINTREFNGLRVIMALINNWDLKDVNNAVLEYDPPRADYAESLYIVSDLGASFGSGRWSNSLTKAKGNLKSYSRSKFISKDGHDDLDFGLAPRPALIHAIVLPLYAQYLGMEWIGKNIPRSDARWIGQLLAQLSPDQIRDAFRAADYSTEEIEGFAEVILNRITELNGL